MRKISVFSNVHGEYGQLEKALELSKGLGASKFYFLGDLVHNGKTYEENRCIDLIKKKAAENESYVIRGNHDNHENLDEEKIMPKNIIYLRNRPTQIYFEDGILLVHNLSEGLERIMNAGLVDKEFNRLAEENKERGRVKIVFFGHPHIPYVFEQSRGRFKPVTEKLEKQPFTLAQEKTYAICPGSVSKGKNDFKSSFLMFDDSSRDVSLHYLS
jgi:predicted phosphodiesterase